MTPPSSAAPIAEHADRLAGLRALAEPARLALVDELAGGAACACELRERLDLSAPLISHHLRVLREAGLVRTRKSGRRLEVELDRAALAALAGSLVEQTG
jgi:DNA-binding transcriptional ArsR family regulator